VHFPRHSFDLAHVSSPSNSEINKNSIILKKREKIAPVVLFSKIARISKQSTQLVNHFLNYYYLLPARPFQDQNKAQPSPSASRVHLPSDRFMMDVRSRLMAMSQLGEDGHRGCTVDTTGRGSTLSQIPHSRALGGGGRAGGRPTVSMKHRSNSIQDKLVKCQQINCFCHRTHSLQKIMIQCKMPTN